jgi:hypothetical protein
MKLNRGDLLNCSKTHADVGNRTLSARVVRHAWPGEGYADSRRLSAKGCRVPPLGEAKVEHFFVRIPAADPQVYVWEMNGLQITAEGAVAHAPVPSDWHVFSQHNFV